jgi:hypothetical protein
MCLLCRAPSSDWPGRGSRLPTPRHGIEIGSFFAKPSTATKSTTEGGPGLVCWLDAERLIPGVRSIPVGMFDIRSRSQRKEP